MNNSALSLAFLSLIITANTLLPAEMPRSLRKAEKLYQNGKYQEASKEALKFQQTSPNNIQCLVILGMSDFYLNDYKKSKKWFKKVKELSKNHPIATRYLELLKEVEYRSGDFDNDPLEKDLTDPMLSGEYFKRAYFGTAFPVESKSKETNKQPQPLEPALIKKAKLDTGVKPPKQEPKPSEVEKIMAAKNANSELENLTATSYMNSMAEKALKDKKYEKAYLFYSQLLAAQPKNRLYAISKAEAAYHLKKYPTVLKILIPISSKSSLSSLSDKDRNKMKELIEKSANKEFIPGK